MKNITLSADEFLIEKARQKAKKERKSLNVVFREWLSRYAGRTDVAQDYLKMMKKLGYARSGHKFTRDEMNER